MAFLLGQMTFQYEQKAAIECQPPNYRWAHKTEPTQTDLQ